MCTCIKTYDVMMCTCIKTYDVIMCTCIKTYDVMMCTCIKTYDVMMCTCIKTYDVMMLATRSTTWCSSCTVASGPLVRTDTRLTSGVIGRTVLESWRQTGHQNSPFSTRNDWTIWTWVYITNTTTTTHPSLRVTTELFELESIHVYNKHNNNNSPFSTYNFWTIWASTIWACVNVQSF